MAICFLKAYSYQVTCTFVATDCYIFSFIFIVFYNYFSLIYNIFQLFFLDYYNTFICASTGSKASPYIYYLISFYGLRNNIKFLSIKSVNSDENPFIMSRILSFSLFSASGFSFLAFYSSKSQGKAFCTIYLYLFIGTYFCYTLDLESGFGCF